MPADRSSSKVVSNNYPHAQLILVFKVVSYKWRERKSWLIVQTYQLNNLGSKFSHSLVRKIQVSNEFSLSLGLLIFEMMIIITVP